MSADNGIYILKMKDQSRVIHAQAIENLYWSMVDMKEVPDLVPTRIIEYYGHVSPMSSDECQKKAFAMEKDILDDDFCPILEYGICTLEVNKTWNEIVSDAKELIEKEISHVQSLPENKKNIWIKQLENLREVINR
jgi:hypothetical protein